MKPETILDRRELFTLVAASIAPLVSIGCGDPGAGTVSTEGKGGAPARLKRLEEIKDEAAKKKKGGR
ncbi:MAG: hypothetical protein U0800_09990 [Isosphaeraceae bacterium]